MEFDEFQRKALVSVAFDKKDAAALAHRTLGVAGEAGELANIVKKIIRDKNGQINQEDIEKIAEKLGDVLYYVAVLAEYFDLSLEEVASKILLKSEDFKNTQPTK